MNNILKDIQNRFNVSDVVERQGNLTFITVKKELAISLITHLRDIEGFSHFVLLSAVDWIESNQFQLTYILNNPAKKMDLGIRVFIDRETATMETAHHLWEHVAT